MIEQWQGEAAWRLTFPDEQSAPQGAEGKFLAQRQLRTGDLPVLATGLGEGAELDTQRLRRAGAKAVRTARQFGADAAVLIPPEGAGAEGLTALAMGAGLSLLEPERFGKRDETPPFRLYMDLGAAPEGEGILAEVNGLVRANQFVRDLTNRPANLCTPDSMAEAILARAEGTGVQAVALDRGEIEALGMEALLAVGDGAEHPPRLIVLRYNGAPERGERIALVGKGITCDTGGYCLKPAGGMVGIRGDMAGGAAVCGALLALAAQRAPVNAVAVVPAAENRISPGSYLPGDVIGSMAGLRISIGNTDAEGRLVLCDAITYAIREEGATHIVDVATLTGQAHAFFGHITTPMLASDDGFAQRLEWAARAADEPVWRIPGGEAYRNMLDSPVADISNMSSGGCGTITGGCFWSRLPRACPGFTWTLRAPPGWTGPSWNTTPRGPRGSWRRRFTGSAESPPRRDKLWSNLPIFSPACRPARGAI